MLFLLKSMIISIITKCKKTKPNVYKNMSNWFYFIETIKLKFTQMYIFNDQQI